MTKATEGRKIRRIEEARKNKARLQAQSNRLNRGEVSHWHELISYCPPDEIKPVDLKLSQGYRTFVHGSIEDLRIVEVPSNMPSESVKALGESMGALGVKALIISDNVRFMKLRPCTFEECELLDETDSEKTGTLYAKGSHGTGPESNGHGDSGNGSAAAPNSPGGGEDKSTGTDASPAGEDC